MSMGNTKKEQPIKWKLTQDYISSFTDEFVAIPWLTSKYHWYSWVLTIVGDTV